MTVREIVTECLKEEVEIGNERIDENLTLNELGVSSIIFFKVIASIGEKLEIDLMDIDVSKVNVEISTQELVSYLENVSN